LFSCSFCPLFQLPDDMAVMAVYDNLNQATHKDFDGSGDEMYNCAVRYAIHADPHLDRVCDALTVFL
jgi:hypothetical protein